MRVLIVRPGPSFSVQDVAFGWRDALREYGVKVGDFNLDDRLDFYTGAHLNKDGEGWVKCFELEAGVHFAAKDVHAVCYEWDPDVVIVVTAMFIPPRTLELMRARGQHVVLLFTESPYEDDRQLELAHLANTVILNDPLNLERFRAVNPDTYYVPHAYNPAVHHPGPADPAKKCDFAFVGTGFPSRARFFEEVDLDGLDVILAGCWLGLDDESPLNELLAHPKAFCLDNAETAELYRSTRSSLNMYRREHRDGEGATADGVAMGPREVELAACETFFLRDSRPEGDEVLHMLPRYSEAAEVRPLLDYWLGHDEEREEVARQARAAIADRTFRNNAGWLLRHITKGQ